MKVIKEGKEKSWISRQKCTGKGNGGGGCGAVLAVSKDDLFHTSSTDMSGYTETFVTFRCPQCGVESDIPPEGVPYSFCPLPSKSEWDSRHRPDRREILSALGLALATLYTDDEIRGEEDFGEISEARRLIGGDAEMFRHFVMNLMKSLQERMERE